ncbi:hypothetical protein [Blastococcus sp. SYSU D00813]
MSQRTHAEGALEGEPRAPGGLDGLLSTAPTFSGALRGYDRLQVDNYVAWAEAEIALARREADHLLSRYAACSAELQNARCRLAQLHRERETAEGRGLAEEVLARAAEEAEALTAGALEEAQRTTEEARAEAQARLEKVEAMRAAAVAERDTARVEARGLRQQAALVLAAARDEAAALLAEAERRRDDEDARARQDREAAEAASAARLAGAQAEVDDLRRQRDEARQSLRRLTGQLEDVLSSVAGGSADLVVLGDGRRPVAS